MIELLQDTVSRQAEQRGDAVALVLGDDRRTYAELEESSNRLAHFLGELGARRGDRVCLFLPKSPDAIVAMLATLKAGCIYVPIDIASPAPRVEKIVESAEPRVAFVAGKATGLMDELVRQGGLDPQEVVLGAAGEASISGEHFEARFSGADWADQPAERPASEATSEDLAHILFTSGSTGQPKGVMIKHANVVAFIEWATRYFATKPGDRISGHPPLHFDLSTFDIYGTFLAGGELHLVPASYNLLPQKLAQFIQQAELTQWFSVPSTMTFMAKFGVVRAGAFPSLERVLWCGEVLPTPILIQWMEALPGIPFTNLYGPTEATIASSYYTAPEIPTSETDPIPIGVACAGEELLVLDESLTPVPAGEVGDLFIGGDGLSPGYWRDEEKTAAAFLPDSRSDDPSGRIYRTGDLARVGEDGLVYFLGRADSQIKSRGYRIELGEIETALNAFEELSECAVVGVDTGGFEGTAICCAYAPADNATVEPPDLRQKLAELLPSYMLPTRWASLEVLPKNVNGKIDRRGLRDLFEARETEAAAKQPVARAERVGR